jgi:hypothetical protein
VTLEEAITVLQNGGSRAREALPLVKAALYDVVRTSGRPVLGQDEDWFVGASLRKVMQSTSRARTARALLTSVFLSVWNDHVAPTRSSWTAPPPLPTDFEEQFALLAAAFDEVVLKARTTPPTGTMTRKTLERRWPLFAEYFKGDYGKRPQGLSAKDVGRIRDALERTNQAEGDELREALQVLIDHYFTWKKA